MFVCVFVVYVYPLDLEAQKVVRCPMGSGKAARRGLCK